MPKTLSPAETDSIRVKYSGQRQTLQAEKVLVERQLREAEASVRAKYKSLREPLDTEESGATRKLESRIETIQKKYKEQYASFERIRRKLDEDFRRTAAEIEEKCNKERRNLFALHWEQEKIRRRLKVFSRITFSVYLKRVFGLS